jgi:hypothetical protein
MSFVWTCDSCDYQFTTIAIFKMPTQGDHKIAA